MKAEDLVQLADDELEKRLAELERELVNLRFQKTVGQLEKSHRLRQVRKDIARIKTIQRQRELAAGAARRGRR